MSSADIQSLILAMRSGNIPDCKIAANKYFALGGTAEFLLSELNKDESLNVGFIISYFIIAGKESDQSALEAWRYLQSIFVKYPDLFEIGISVAPKELGQEARDILVAAQKYLLLPERIAPFVKIALETSEDRIARRKKLLKLLGKKNALKIVPYDQLETLNERCLFDVKLLIANIYNHGKVESDSLDTLSTEEIDLASRAGMVGNYPLYKNLSLLADTNDESYLCYNKWICKYFLPYAIKIDDVHSPYITSELYYSICGRDAHDENDYDLLCPIKCSCGTVGKSPAIFYQSPTVKLNIVIGEIWEHFCQTLCARRQKNVITNNDPRIRLPNNAIPDIAYGENLKFECGRLVFAKTIIECKKSMYFMQERLAKNGVGTILNNETTDKYYEYCEEFQYWVLEKPVKYSEKFPQKVKVVFAEDLLNDTELNDHEREYLTQLLALVHLKNSKLLQYMSEEERSKAMKAGDYWDNEAPQKWVSDINNVAPLLNICVDDLVGKPKEKLPFTPKNKNVIRQYNQKGEFIREFSDTREAAQEAGVSIDSICDAAAGRKISAAGYLWRRCPVGSIIENIEPIKPLDITNRKILQINLNGEIIAEFKTIAEASRVVCIDRKGIRDVICGRQKTAGGFFWKAIEQD